MHGQPLIKYALLSQSVPDFHDMAPSFAKIFLSTNHATWMHLQISR